MAKKRRFKVLAVLDQVNISGGGYYAFYLKLQWKDEIRKAIVEPEHDTIIFPRIPDRYTTLATVYPKYLWREIWQGIHAHFQEHEPRFFEYDRDGYRRYEPLRYHSGKVWQEVLDHVEQLASNEGA